MKPTSHSKRSTPRLKGVSLGIELAATLIGFTLLGLWIDRTYQTGPSGLLICLAIGGVGGFYNFIRSSLRAMSAPPSRHGAKDDEHSQQ